MTDRRMARAGARAGQGFELIGLPGQAHPDVLVVRSQLSACGDAVAQILHLVGVGTLLHGRQRPIALLLHGFRALR